MTVKGSTSGFIQAYLLRFISTLPLLYGRMGQGFGIPSVRWFPQQVPPQESFSQGVCQVSSSHMESKLLQTLGNFDFLFYLIKYQLMGISFEV